jgi:glutathione S-transferase
MVWLLQECSKDLDWDIKTYKRGPDMLAPASLKEAHPLGKSPVITFESSATSGKPLALAESGAISEFLADHFAPHLVPKRYREGMEGQPGGETEQFLRYRFYMHWTEGSLMTMLLVGLIMDSKSSLYCQLVWCSALTICF